MEKVINLEAVVNIQAGVRLALSAGKSLDEVANYLPSKVGDLAALQWVRCLEIKLSECSSGVDAWEYWDVELSQLLKPAMGDSKVYWDDMDIAVLESLASLGEAFKVRDAKGVFNSPNKET